MDRISPLPALLRVAAQTLHVLHNSVSLPLRPFTPDASKDPHGFSRAFHHHKHTIVCETLILPTDWEYCAATWLWENHVQEGLAKLVSNLPLNAEFLSKALEIPKGVYWADEYTYLRTPLRMVVAEFSQRPETSSLPSHLAEHFYDITTDTLAPTKVHWCLHLATAISHGVL